MDDTISRQATIDEMMDNDVDHAQGIDGREKEILTSMGVCVMSCQKQWHADAVAVPTHLKTVCLPFHNCYHPDGVFKLKERRMSIDEIIGRLVSMIGKKVSFEDMDPIIDYLSFLSLLIETDGWTPCSEGLPKIAGEYLVTYHPCYWGEVRPELKVGFDSFRGKSSWAKNKYQKVVAWKEKPEPYLGDVK